jgi:hypothetical protein
MIIKEDYWGGRNQWVGGGEMERVMGGEIIKYYRSTC